MRIGTRRSALALAQAELVAGMLRELPGSHEVEIVPIVTSGDRGAGTSDKSRWVSALEQALLDEGIDLAVHSAKDVPGELTSGTELFSTTVRAPAEDVLCGAEDLASLPEGARVGTSSLRRVAQLRAAREDLEIVPLRGNVDTRLAKLADAEQRLDAIVLARAGLVRLGRDDEASATLDPARFVPAPGQGALALQGRCDDADARVAAEAIGDEGGLRCLLAERALASGLQADCDTPLGAHAVCSPDGTLTLRAWVGLPDGSAWALDELTGDADGPEPLGAAVAERLRTAGAESLLERAREMAGDGL